MLFCRYAISVLRGSCISERKWRTLFTAWAVELTSSSQRRNLGSESLAASEPRERVLSLWTVLLKNELMDQDLSIENVVKDPSNPGKMCRKCYYSYEKCANLQKKLMSNLHDALKKLNPSQTSSPYIHDTTPTRKRMLDCRDNALCPEKKSCYFAIYYHFTTSFGMHNYYIRNCNSIIVIVIYYLI